MKIHTNTLTYADFFAACDAVKAATGAPVYFHGDETLPRRGSRTHARAFDVKLASDGTLTRRRVNYGTARHLDRFDRPYSASYDQWGWFLAHLFDVDPGAMIPYVYDGADDFHRKTADKYRSTATV